MEIETFKGNPDGKYVKVFFAVEDGNVVGVTVGNQAIPVEQGFQFFVEPHVALQIDKCELYMDSFAPRLRVIEGEELEVPDEKEKRIRELEEELERLKKEA
ncbi:hypothetical protein MUB24_03470 [Lederbergia sp. NSJ-179]|uniref:hypothetical protein n=1 Tax=Lederbergia sp. NSJ-179 TaxID=2931402 RepID=UPI001FD0E0B5|nr:hypothetical protein [Lederbergia sp. NSJ-179]MCJ7839987.1 hypothetical protein [Lederbergia sp. NSJ-179]